STNYATSTEYIFNGDTFVATVDQAFKNGSATGTAQTRYIHADHLGSTNVITNASGTPVQTLDYYPYGALRVSTNTGPADSARKYIGQFADSSGLDYLNARYYSSDRGQFITQDPVFWEIGLTLDGKKALANPQYVNSYAYSSNNPITTKDPSGRMAWVDDALSIGVGGVVNTGVYLASTAYAGEKPTWGGAAGAFVSGGIMGWADKQNAAIVKLIGLVIHAASTSVKGKHNWLKEQWLFDDVMDAIAHTLLWFRPGGDSGRRGIALSSGTDHAAQLMAEIRSSDPSLPITEGTRRQHQMAALKGKLGELVDHPHPYDRWYKIEDTREKEFDVGKRKHK